MPPKKTRTTKPKKTLKKDHNKKNKKKVDDLELELEVEQELAKFEKKKIKTPKKKKTPKKPPKKLDKKKKESDKMLDLDDEQEDDWGDDWGDEDVEEKEEKDGKKKSWKEKRKEKKSHKKHKKSKKHKKKNIDRELEEIYEDDDGEIPDMKKFEKRKKRRWLRALIILLVSCVVLAAVAWVGFFVLGSGSSFSEEDVSLEIVGDEQVTSGQLVHYTIAYKNEQRLPLAQTKLQIRYPEGFVFDKAVPEPTGGNNDEWELGTLDSDMSGVIELFGYLYGDLEKEQSFRGFLNYYPANFSSEFQKVVNLTTKITDSPVEMVVNGPGQVNAGSEVELSVDLTNLKDDETISNLAVVLEPGDNFTVKDSNIDAQEDNALRWEISELVESQTLTIIGTYSLGEDTNLADVAVKLYSWKDDEKEEEYLLANKTHQVEVLKTTIAANLVINGTLSDFEIRAGETLNASIIVRNTGDNTIEDATVQAVFDAPSHSNLSILKWAGIDDELDGDIDGEQLSSDVRRGIITWDKTKLDALSSIAPGDEAMINFSLPIKTAADIDLTEFASYTAKVGITLEYTEAEEEKSLDGNSLEFIINSDTSLEVTDLMSKLESGGEKHTMAWKLENNFHALEDISVEADIYGDITWLEDDLSVPAGEASFDADRQRLTWTMDTMPVELDVLALQFAVTLSELDPSQSNLTSKVRFKATDTVTGQEIILSGSQVLLEHETEEE